MPLAVDVTDRMRKNDLTVRMVSMHTAKPLDARLLAESFDHCEFVASIKEHSVLGGSGSTVAE